MRQLVIMTASDLRRRVRDKSVLIFGLVVPLALMGVFNLLFSGLEEDGGLDPVTIVAGTTDDPMAGVVLQSLRGIDAMDVTVREVPEDEVRDLAAAGDAALGVLVPDDFAQSVTSGEPTTLRLVQGDGAGLEASILISVVNGVVDQMHAGAVAAQAASMAGVPPDRLAAIAEQAAAAGQQIALTEGRAADEQLTMKGQLVAGQTGLFLLFTVGFGVLALLAEREEGTMARLQSMPMRPGLIVAAKALTGFLLGVLATSVLLTLGTLMLGVDFGSVPAVAVLVVLVVAAATSLTFIVARVAKTAEQSNVMQSILAVLLGMAGGAFFPIPATGAVATLLDLNPIAAFVRGLGITSGGGGLSDLGAPALTMVGFAVVCLAVSRIVPDRAGTA